MGYTIAVIIAILLFFSSIKKKQKVAKQIYKDDEVESGMTETFASEDIESKDEYEAEDLSLENDTFEQPFVYTENENLEEISAKNATYFTYEEDSTNQVDSVQKSEKIDISAQENKLQNSENEQERPLLDLNNPEELKKAFIYSEILQNPYI